MDAGTLGDKGLWAIIALAIAGLLGFFKSEGARRARRRAEQAANQAAAAEHQVAHEHQQLEEVQAHAKHDQQQAAIAGMDGADVLADANRRLERERTAGAGLPKPPERRP